MNLHLQWNHLEVKITLQEEGKRLIRSDCIQIILEEKINMELLWYTIN